MPKSKKRKLSTSAVKTKNKSQVKIVQSKAPQIVKGKKGLLHVGCGTPGKKKLPKPLQGEEWQEIRLDIDPKVNPDIVGDITDMVAVPDNYCDTLFSSHNLEHIYSYQTPQAMNEFFRVVQVGGRAIITLPDLQAVAIQVAQGLWDEPLYDVESGPVTPRDIFYGLDRRLAAGQHYMAHKNGFTAHSLGRAMLRAGFCNVIIERDGHYNLWARGDKLPKDHPNYKNQAQVKGNYPHLVVRRASDGSDDPSKKTDELDAEPKRWDRIKISNG